MLNYFNKHILTIIYFSAFYIRNKIFYFRMKIYFMTYKPFDNKKTFIFLIMIFIFGSSFSYAQKKKSKNKKDQKIAEKATIKTIKEATKSCKKIDGLFTMYRDTLTGETFMLVKKNQINKEFIHFSQISDGVSDAGWLIRGMYMDSKIFSIEKFYNKLNFVAQNTSYYFDKNNPLAKASNSNISEGIMASLKIIAQNQKNGEYLVASDDLFLKETFNQIKSPKSPKTSPKAFKLGELSKNKSKIEKIKNYPENTNINAHYVYFNKAVLNGGTAAVTDGRNVTIKIEHSLIALPKNEYQIRLDDPRIGYFLTQVTDKTSASATPYRDLIHRWHLVKKDKNAALSEPIKPIVWWMENTTPFEFRNTIKEAVLEWNKAFEKAGFKNAIEVKMQPDDAKWDAGDIRYNVLRWTSSPNPPFGGYGPSFVNPRTGQILGADIMLEYVYHTNRVKLDRIFNLGVAANEFSFNTEMNTNDISFCSYGHEMQNNMLFGQTTLLVNDANDNEMKGLRMEAMKELIMHEVGHTLGLNHNMKASQLFSPAELANPDFIKDKCLTGSVMDYSAVNITLDPKKQGQYYSTTVGPYDAWAIEYGYTPTNEEGLKAITNKSIQPELTFGNDADDMRNSGKAIDPRVMIGDMSNDQITYAVNRIKVVENTMPKIKDKFNKNGQSYQELRQAFSILNRQYAWSGVVISRFIGGVYVDRSMIGQDTTKKPYTPVAYKDQKRAMEALKKYIFAPDAFKTSNDLYNYIAMQRRGFNFFNSPEDPKIHSMVLSYQKRILNHLLHHNTMQRISDSELYGNNYKLSEFMSDLNEAIFKADAKISINTFRQNLQQEYVTKLIAITNSKTVKQGKSNYLNLSKAAALYNLKKIKDLLISNNGDSQTKAHKYYLKTLINNTMENLK